MSNTHMQLHPDFKQLSMIHPPINRFSIALIQPLMRLLLRQQRSDAALEVKRLKIETAEGHRLPALLYTPKDVKTNGCLLCIHGGGFVFPAAPHHYALARLYAVHTGCRVLLIDYRLAPKHPFPAAPRDCFAAYRWLLDHAEALGIDPAKIAVGGDSAGGTLSMVVTLMALEQHVPVPCAQLLTYPSVGNCGETESIRLYTDTPMCSSKDMAKYGRLYTPDPNADKLIYRSPIEAESLEGVPPTYIETAEFDCLRDGALLYAEKLRQAGIPVELHPTKGTVHGYDMALRSGIVQGLIRKRTAFLTNIFETH